MRKKTDDHGNYFAIEILCFKYFKCKLFTNMAVLNPLSKKHTKTRGIKSASIVPKLIALYGVNFHLLNRPKCFINAGKNASLEFGI